MFHFCMWLRHIQRKKCMEWYQFFICLQQPLNHFVYKKHCHQNHRHTIWLDQKQDYTWNITILYHINTTVLFWSATHWKIEMDASKNTWKFQTCITVHQTSAPPDLIMWHYTSTSKKVGCHQVCLLQSLSTNNPWKT